jgi:hypothetical protein
VDLRDGFGADVGDDGMLLERPPYAKEEWMPRMALISSWRRSWSSKIYSLLKKD